MVLCLQHSLRLLFFFLFFFSLSLLPSISRVKSFFFCSFACLFFSLFLRAFGLYCFYTVLVLLLAASFFLFVFRNFRFRA